MQPGLGIRGQKPAKAGNLPFVTHDTRQPRQHQLLHTSALSLFLRTSAV